MKPEIRAVKVLVALTAMSLALLPAPAPAQQPGGIRAQGEVVRLISDINRSVGEPETPGERAKWPLGFGLLALTLLAISAVLWFQVFQASDGKLHVYFLDVGQGDSILIITPHP